MKMNRLVSSTGCVLCLVVAVTLALPVVPKATGKTEETEDGSPKVASAEKELIDVSKTEQTADAPVSISQDAPAPQEQSAVAEEAVMPVESQGQEQAQDEAQEEEGQQEADALPQQAQESYFYPDLPAQEESYVPSDPLADIDLSPKAIAEYLLITGDFSGFDNAIADLMATGMLTPSEVARYRDAVSVQYEAMLKNMIEAQSTYLQELAAPLQRNYPSLYDLEGVDEAVLPPVQLPPASQDYPQGMMELGDVDLEDEMRSMQLENALNKEQNLGQLLQSLLDDYYTDDQPAAVQASNPEPEVDYNTLIDLVQKAMQEEELENTPVEEETKTQVQHESPSSVEQELKALEHPEQPESTEPKKQSSEASEPVKNELTVNEAKE